MNAEEINTEVIDGYLIDVTTGEILGLAGPSFQVNDEGSLNWVMSKMLAEDAAIAAIDSTEAVIHARAILDNALKMRKDRQRRLDWLHGRFDEEIGRYVRPLLDGKSKTYRTIYGSISFRFVKGGVRVVDEAAAYTWLNAYYPGCEGVSLVPRVLISQIPQAVKEHIAQRSDVTGIGGFELKPDMESVSVKTGIEKG